MSIGDIQHGRIEEGAPCNGRTQRDRKYWLQRTGGTEGGLYVFGQSKVTDTSPPAAKPPGVRFHENVPQKAYDIWQNSPLNQRPF